MSNDLDNEDFESDTFDEFGEGNGGKGTLGDLIQSNPLVKIGVIFGAAALIFGTIILFSGKKEQELVSSVSKAPEMTMAPGTEAVNPAYLDAIQEVNQRTTEEAIRQGDSAIPIPIEPPVGRLETTPDQEAEEDPLQKWRRLQDERIQKELEQRRVIEPTALPEDNSHNEAVNALAQALRTQMQAVLENQGTFQHQVLQISDPELLKNLAEEEQAANAKATEQASTNATVPEIVVVPAGEIAYAQIITEANSDVPGPVLAQIVSGPLAGSRVLGNFSVEKDLISLQFNTVVVDGVSYSIDAIALDPETTLPAMATEVDHRYFQRVILPTAAAFIEGAAEVIADRTTRTTVAADGNFVVAETDDADVKEQIAGGIEKAGEELSEIIDDMNEDIETLVIVHAGTPMGLLFLTPMTRPMTEDDY